MANVTVQVWDATGNKRQEVEMPDDAPVNRILAVLLEKMSLPQSAPDGQPLSYKFHHKASGKQLLDEQCLRDVAVKDGDVLRLQPEITARRDLRSMRMETLNTTYAPRAFPLPGAARAGFQAVLRQSALDAVRAHGRSSISAEVCGVLVGDAYRDPAGPWLHVRAAIPGRFAASQPAQVTFTADTWAYVQRVMDEQYPNSKIVGWYHTHPNFGIFLSDMDLFIHRSFFNLPWQAALVHDPVRGQEGLFLWEAGEAVERPFLIEPIDP